MLEGAILQWVVRSLPFRLSQFRFLEYRSDWVYSAWTFWLDIETVFHTGSRGVRLDSGGLRIYSKYIAVLSYDKALGEGPQNNFAPLASCCRNLPLIRRV
ncbi:hypothetical protein AVEN_11587-1 [Araneus ventricosus]|uniref:Uncharacterized protein n=1 Tax=Araneus ventricosus TaxID=182803 RepID=A0A4Y2V367_ARAVE|nr:hypothetical protein AVEN_11587-1 [Araneus ventricosus]